jgi:hypothetical protein
MATIKTRTRILVDLEPSQRKRLQSNADDHERSLAAEVRLALREYLDNLDRKRRR